MKIQSISYIVINNENLNYRIIKLNFIHFFLKITLDI